MISLPAQTDGSPYSSATAGIIISTVPAYKDISSRTRLRYPGSASYGIGSVYRPSAKIAKYPESA